MKVVCLSLFSKLSTKYECNNLYLMSRANEIRFLVKHELYECKYVDWMKVYFIQNKNETMMNVIVTVKNQMIGVLA